MYFDIEIPRKDHRMLHQGLWSRLSDWITVHQNEICADKALVQLFFHCGLWSLAEKLVLQSTSLCTLMQDWSNTELVLLWAERVKSYLLRSFSTWSTLTFCDSANASNLQLSDHHTTPIKSSGPLQIPCWTPAPSRTVPIKPALQILLNSFLLQKCN